MKKTKLWEFFICTLLPIVIPFISLIPNNIVHDCVKIGLQLALLILDVYLTVRLYKKTNKENLDRITNKIIRESYSNAYTLSERKRNEIIIKTYDEYNSIKDYQVPYDVHNHISEICISFRDTISQITSINKEYINTSFIYHYIFPNAKDEEKSWKWIFGKELASKVDLDEFVYRQNTLYEYIINGDDKHKSVYFVFSNSKQDLCNENRYHMSPKDDDHNDVGSVFAARIVFGNNISSFIECVLLLSTYGKQFIEKDTAQYTETELKNILLEELFPYYQRLIETELGMLYLQHLSKHD